MSLLATHSARRYGLDLARLGADHAAVAVEGREALRQLERVGGDPVRRTTLGGGGELAGEVEQLLDQRALAGVKRRGRTG